MKELITILVMAVVVTLSLSGCSTTKSTAEQLQMVERNADTMVPAVAPSAKALPQVIVYKTRKNYASLVPVMMNSSKTRILSYPAPADVKNARPIALDAGYMIDNRGIGPNVAFTDYTYEEYAAMAEAPTLDQLMQHIVDIDPLLEMYIVPVYRQDNHSADEINEVVADGFTGCQRIK